MAAARGEAPADVGGQVEALLARCRQQGGEQAAATAEDVVRVLVDFYGSGLERITEIIATERPELIGSLAADPLVESQLILHGLHPLGIHERIEQALDRVRPYLGSHAGGVAFLGVDDGSIAHLRLDGSCHGCPSSTVTVRMTIEEAVMGAAPELAGIDVEGEAERPAQLLQIGRRPGSPEPERAPAVWVHPSALDLPVDGHASNADLDGRRVVMCRLGDVYYAYVDSCPACAGSLLDGELDGEPDGAALTGDLLSCAGCGATFDVRLAGRATANLGMNLEPLPLLDDVSGIRIALVPEAVR